MTIDTNRHIAEIINSKFRVIKKLQKYVSETQAQIEDQMDKLEKIIDDLVWCEIHECERDHLCKGCKRYQETGYMHEGFSCNNPEKYTRSWFAWANSLFALYLLELWRNHE